MDNPELNDYDRQTVLMALKQREHSLWSIELSDRQRDLRTRYKLLFEKLGGDYNRNYEQEFLRGE